MSVPRFLPVLKPKGEVALSATLSERAMVFQLAGNQLIAKEWDRAEWGEKGPGALFRVDR